MLHGLPVALRSGLIDFSPELIFRRKRFCAIALRVTRRLGQVGPRSFQRRLGLVHLRIRGGCLGISVGVPGVTGSLGFIQRLYRLLLFLQGPPLGFVSSLGLASFMCICA